MLHTVLPTSSITSCTLGNRYECASLQVSLTQKLSVASSSSSLWCCGQGKSIGRSLQLLPASFAESLRKIGELVNQEILKWSVPSFAVFSFTFQHREEWHLAWLKLICEECWNSLNYSLLSHFKFPSDISNKLLRKK